MTFIPTTFDPLEQKAGINTVRAISSAWLHIFLCLHLHPINLVVSKGTYDPYRPEKSYL